MYLKAVRLFWKFRPITIGVGILLVPFVVLGAYWLIIYVQSQVCISLVLNSQQNKLAFEKYQLEDDHAIYMMTSDGGLECRVSVGSSDDYLPAWSPDGRFIAFVTPYPNAGIFVMNSNGSERRKVVGEGGGWLYGKPAWSPDSKSIAFSKFANYIPSKLYIANIEDTNQVRLLREGGGDNDNSPAWSPDGKHIAFNLAKNRASSDDIYVIDIDGSNERQLTQNGGIEPAWSPDGRQLAFYHVLDGVSLMDADGNNIHQIVSDGANSPTWSPDGKQIAVTKGGAIYVVNVDGTDLRLITRPDDSHVDWTATWKGTGS